MSFGTYETPKLPSIPTFAQYLKTCSKGVEGKTKFAVDIVWLPGKFDNVTLQTHAFRYICNDSHLLYAEMRSYLDVIVLKDIYPALEITIDSLEQRTISVNVSRRKRGEWEKMGSNAFKFKPS